MNSHSLRRRIAEWLIVHADRCLPRTRRDWGQAMRAELEHIEHRHLFGWAIGCVVASYSERMKMMNRSDWMVSKWVFAIEALTCFGPLSLLWLVAIFNLSKFLGEPKTLFDIAFTSIAPSSLILAMRFVLFGRLPNYRLQFVLAFAFVALGIFLIVRKTGPGPNLLWSQVEWGLILLFSLLPALCNLHLAQFAKPSSV